MTTRPSGRTVVLAGLVLSLVLAGVVSGFASSAPDGLSRVAAEQGIDQKQRDHTLDDGPLSGYEADGVGNARLSGGLAGVVGVAVTFALAGGAFFLLRRSDGRREPDES